MKLKDFLQKEVTEGQTIAVGTNEGSGYLYFGENSIEKIYEIFEQYKKKLAKNQENNKRKIERLTMIIPDLNKKDREGNPRDPFDIKFEYADKLSKHVTSYINKVKYFNKYVDPMKREVSDSYIIEGTDIIAIILIGKEVGNYWDYEEWCKVNK